MSMGILSLKFFLKKWFLALVFILTSFSYSSILIPPNIFWPITLISYTIPIVILCNLIIFIIIALQDWKLSLIPLVLLLVAFPFISNTIKFNFSRSSNSEDLSVLSFNAKLFRERNTYSEFSEQMISWVVSDSSTVKCIQEFSTNDKWEALDIKKRISSKGYYSFTFTAGMTDIRHNLGLAIFSKYPIIDSGYVWQDYGSINAGIFTDIKLGRDTLRIYNVHLASMYLELPKKTIFSFSTIKKLPFKLGISSKIRYEQIKKIISHAKRSPHVFIVCGDFNDTPYSFNYLELKKHYSNAFDEKGMGVGYTYNGFPYLLRIDHQFYSKGLKITNYLVDETMRVSDHFPTRGFYQINKLQDFKK